MEKLSKEREQTTITGLRVRDRKVFARVYDLYWSRLYVSAFNMLRNREQAEDVVQEVFAYLWNNAPDLRIKSLNAWLFTAVRYQVFNVIRSGKVRERFESLLITEESTENIAELRLDHEDIRKSLAEGLNQLPPRCREIFLLSRFDYLTHREIAQKLNLSEKTVENQIAIALKRLRKIFGPLLFALLTGQFFT